MAGLIFFDLDGTLTRTKSPWQYLHERLGMWDGLGVNHLNDWLAGRIDYEEFFDRDVEMWIGLEKSVVLGELDRIEFRQSAPPLLAEIRARGLRAAIISSGFSHLAERLSRETGFGFAEVHANEMLFGPKDRLSGVRLNVSGDPEHEKSKRRILLSCCERLAVDPDETIAVGDSESDGPMFEAAGFSIGLDSGGGIGADVHINPDSLLEILDYV